MDGHSIDTFCGCTYRMLRDLMATSCSEPRETDQTIAQYFGRGGLLAAITSDLGNTFGRNMLWILYGPETGMTRHP